LPQWKQIKGEWAIEPTWKVARGKMIELGSPRCEKKENKEEKTEKPYQVVGTARSSDRGG